MPTRSAEENSIESIFDLAAKDPSYRPRFYELLLSDNLVAIGGGEPARPSGEYQGGDTINVYPLSDGRTPIFTSIARIFDSGIVKGEVKYFEMKGRDLLRIISNNVAVINPFSECSKELTVSEMRRLLEGSWSLKVEPFAVGEVEGQIVPTSYPNEATEALTNLFIRRPAVLRSYFGMIKYREGDTLSQGHSFLGIEVEGNLESIRRESAEVLRAVLPDEPMFDILDMKAPLGEQISAKMQPFYQRDAESRRLQ